MTTQITAQELNAEQFIHEKVGEIKAAVGEGMAINALSGGVDSSTVTMLGHRALGNQLKTVFIENGHNDFRICPTDAASTSPVIVVACFSTGRSSFLAVPTIK